jgi:hypothetical protein
MKPGDRVRITRVSYLYRRELHAGMEGIYLRAIPYDEQRQLYQIEIAGWQTPFALMREEFEPLTDVSTQQKGDHTNG